MLFSLMKFLFWKACDLAEARLSGREVLVVTTAPKPPTTQHQDIQ